MRILMVGSEVLPFAKTGGLADVLGALPRALARLGHEVDVVMPRYQGVPAGDPGGTVTVRLGGTPREARVGVVREGGVREGGVRTILVDYPPYFDRPFLYGPAGDDYADNAERFAFLSAAALEWAAATSLRFDVVHGHDWQAGLAPVLLRNGYAPEAVAGVPAVFTIHNLAYQGVFDAGCLARLGLDSRLMGVDALEYWNRVSYLKGGIMFSRLITTVSPRYAAEIQTPEFGFGFEGILAGRAGDLVGILNGIDYDQWDPARDAHLPAPFDVADVSGKAVAKKAVLDVYGLPTDPVALGRPLVGLVSRLVDQKGFDLVAEIADELPRLDASYVVLGSGDSRYEDMWRGLASRHPGRIGVQIGFDEPLAHLIEGGADLFLMPSRFEPCGLNQMYSLRYGTVPVVRSVGGLHDTVRDVDPRTGTGTGFTFAEYSARALLDTLRRALDAHRDAGLWRRVQREGMTQDFSWDASARQYVKVYERAAA